MVEGGGVRLLSATLRQGGLQLVHRLCLEGPMQRQLALSCVRTHSLE